MIFCVSFGEKLSKTYWPLENLNLKKPLNDKLFLYRNSFLQIINYTIVIVFEVQLLAGKFQIIYWPLNNKAFLYKHSL